MSSTTFVQVNSRNLSETISKIDGHKAVGFEVIEKEIVTILDINIDPQHGGVKLYDEITEPENKSASLFVLGKLPTIDPTYQNVIVLPSKLDIDSLCAATMWHYADFLSQMENDPQNYDKFLALCDRVKSVDIIDCGLGAQGIEWNPDYYKNQLIKEVTPFNVLGCMRSDFKLPLIEKVGIMLDWLVDGELPENYRKQVELELNAQSKSFTETIHGVTCVTSKSRGATGILYSQSPYGVCYNPEFPTKDGSIPKFTICQFTADKYIDLNGFLSDIKNIEDGWGGNLQAGIVGSPFGGTHLNKNEVCEIVARHIK